MEESDSLVISYKAEGGTDYTQINSSNSTTAEKTGLSIGSKGEIRVQILGKDGTVKIEKVKKVQTGIAVTSITLNKTTASLKVGEELQLTAKVLPEDATNKEVEWTGNNANVATVDNTGKVTAKGSGEVKITATAKDGSGEKAECSITVTKINVADLIDKPADTTKNIEAEDKYGNSITILAGFTVVQDGIDDVEYKYNGDKTPVVQDGIVIKDSEGNQFVWVPVGEIKNKDNTTTNITLGRYTFNIGSYNSTTRRYTGTGKETLVQDATNYIQTVTIENYYKELEESTYGNTTAKDLGEFVTKAQVNGGYYIERYEASKGTDNKAKSKSADVWKDISQSGAAAKAQTMYTSSNFESDLVNSYAWDTAIVFIQNYSGDTDYSKEVGPTFSSSIVNTGTKGDKRCNIYDMASNIWEWSTESCTFVFSAGHEHMPRVYRGGCFANGEYYASRRDYDGVSSGAEGIGFPSLLYVK